MTVIYHTTITRIGASAATALEEQMLITFREGAPAGVSKSIALFTATASCAASCAGRRATARRSGIIR